MIEVGTGKLNVVRLAEEREAEEPATGFLRSLLRCAARDVLAAAEGDAGDDVFAPMVEVNRPHLSRGHVDLLWGHAAVRPLAKPYNMNLRCFRRDGLDRG